MGARPRHTSLGTGCVQWVISRLLFLPRDLKDGRGTSKLESRPPPSWAQCFWQKQTPGLETCLPENHVLHNELGSHSTSSAKMFPCSRSDPGNILSSTGQKSPWHSKEGNEHSGAINDDEKPAASLPTTAGGGRSVQPPGLKVKAPHTGRHRQTC